MNKILVILLSVILMFAGCYPQANADYISELKYVNCVDAQQEISDLYEQKESLFVEMTTDEWRAHTLGLVIEALDIDERQARNAISLLLWEALDINIINVVRVEPVPSEHSIIFDVETKDGNIYRVFCNRGNFMAMGVQDMQSGEMLIIMS